jgi:hypothetical protein
VAFIFRLQAKKRPYLKLENWDRDCPYAFKTSFQKYISAAKESVLKELNRLVIREEIMF